MSVRPEEVVAAIRAAKTDAEALAIERRHVADTIEEDPGRVEDAAPEPPEPARGASASQMARAVAIGVADANYAEGRCNATTMNNTKYGIWYGMNCAAWCAMSVSKWFHDAGSPQPASTSKGFAYTPSGASWYKSKGAWSPASANPDVGWVVFFYSDSAGRIAHVGATRGPRGADGLIPTVEGNTNGAGSAEGGSILLKRRSPSQSLGFRIAGYGRPDLLEAKEWWQMSIPQTELDKIGGELGKVLAAEGSTDWRNRVATVGDIVRAVQFLTKQGNTLFTASREHMEWTADPATITLPELAATLAVGLKLDPDTMQQAFGSIVTEAVRQALAASPIEFDDADADAVAVAAARVFSERLAARPPTVT